MLMTDEQVGKYIRLLCLQHQQGHLTEKDMLKICISRDQDILDKFAIDDNGKYYNERLEQEISKRIAYADSRRNNRKGNKHNGLKPKKHMSNICESYDEHMENENININIDNIIDKDKEIGGAGGKRKRKATPVKSFYGSQNNVALTLDEYDRLHAKYPEADEAIEYLSQYIAEKNYKSESHNMAIQRWVIDAVREKSTRVTKPQSQAAVFADLARRIERGEQI
jgi:hypothetical protein